MTTQDAAPAWTPLAPQEYLPLVEDASARFAAVLDRGDLTAAVHACPGWTLGDLGRHLGNVQLWALHALQKDEPGPDVEDGPTTNDELAAWMRECTAALLAELRSLDPDAPRWNFGPKPRTASFWFRRQTHEALVHLWDAQSAVGEPDPLAPRLAADGIDEIVRMFFPRQVRLGRCAPLDVALSLAPTDVDGADPAWVLAGDGTDPAARIGAADGVLAGPASSILLALWRRLPVDHPTLRHEPDDTVARTVLTAPIVP